MELSGPSRLDDLDFSILDELQEDGRRSFRDIGRRLGVAPATVRARVAALLADEVVEIVAVPNPWKLGLGFFGVVALRIEPKHVSEVAEILAAREDTSYVGIAVTGCEVLFEVALASTRDFASYRENVLAQLPGYRDARVFFMSDVLKVRYRLHRPKGDATPAD
jgi:Lrp/AsnC family transcriptional regulator for asnA, asnC and gidA